MKANELRIGNYVNSKRNRYKEDYIEVESIDYQQINIEFRSYDIEDLQGILLTKDWFVKLGFLEHCISYYNLNGIVIYYANTGLNEYRNKDCNIVIKYVHQLQNLYFALTAEEV